MIILKQSLVTNIVNTPVYTIHYIHDIYWINYVTFKYLLNSSLVFYTRQVMRMYIVSYMICWKKIKKLIIRKKKTKKRKKEEMELKKASTN